MGAKTWMIVYSDGSAPEILQSNPKIDEDKTKNYLLELFPDVELTRIDDGDLSFTNPKDDEIYAGYYNGVFVVAASEIALD